MGVRFAEITLTWADGDYPFRLGLSELEELERNLDLSIYAVAYGLRDMTAKTIVIREVLRNGLIGGGMPPADALAKVRRYVDELPLDVNRMTALAVSLRAIERVYTEEVQEEEVQEEDNQPGEPETAAEMTTDTSASTSPPSEVLPPQTA